MHPVYQPQQHQQYQPQQPNPYAEHQSGFPQQTPYNPYASVQTPTANQQPAGPAHQSQFPPLDPFNSLATSMLQQSGSNYLERGQEFVKSRMLINSSSLHYHFDVDGEYGMYIFPIHGGLHPTLSMNSALQQNCHDCSQKQARDATGTLFEAVVLHSNKGAGLTAYCHACLCCSLGLSAGSIPATHNVLNANTQNCSFIADYRWSPIQVTPTRCQRSRPIHPCLGIVYILYLRQHMHGGQGSMDNRLHVCTRKSTFGHSQLAAEPLLQSCL